jgi:thiamine pyrophosphokinase
MNRCIVICAGETGPIEDEYLSGNLIISCDDGYRIAEEMGIKPHILIGDFDSLSSPLPAGAEIIRFPVEKDDTDSMLAVKEGLKRGFRDFVLVFSLGGRLDHTVANIQLLGFLCDNGAKGQLVGPRDRVMLVKNETVRIKKRPGETLSVFAWERDARGVSLRGVYYPLENAVISARNPIGACNKITGDEAFIAVEDGILLIVCSAE